MRIARCIIDVLSNHGMLNFSPNWLYIGKIGDVDVMSEKFFVVNLSHKRAGELSFNIEHKKDICMIFYLKYNMSIILQDVNLYDLVRMCQSLKSKRDVFYDLCKDITFWKLKALKFGIAPEKLPSSNDPNALRVIVTLIRDQAKQHVLNIESGVYTDDEYIKFLEYYPSREIEYAIIEKKAKTFSIHNKTFFRMLTPLLSEDGLIMFVKAKLDNIMYLDAPSEKVQIAAVKTNAGALAHISNPSEVVQLTAVKKNGLAIQFIKNPSRGVQIEAVKNHGGMALRYIPNPSKEVQLAAIKKDGFAIQYIKNPSEDIQLEAVTRKASAIKYIPNPSEKVQIAAIKKSAKTIFLIANPTEKVKKLVF